MGLLYSPYHAEADFEVHTFFNCEPYTWNCISYSCCVCFGDPEFLEKSQARNKNIECEMIHSICMGNRSFPFVFLFLIYYSTLKWKLSE